MALPPEQTEFGQSDQLPPDGVAQSGRSSTSAVGGPAPSPQQVAGATGTSPGEAGGVPSETSGLGPAPEVAVSAPPAAPAAAAASTDVEQRRAAERRQMAVRLRAATAAAAAARAGVGTAVRADLGHRTRSASALTDRASGAPARESTAQTTTAHQHQATEVTPGLTARPEDALAPTGPGAPAVCALSGPPGRFPGPGQASRAAGRPSAMADGAGPSARAEARPSVVTDWAAPPAQGDGAHAVLTPSVRCLVPPELRAWPTPGDHAQAPRAAVDVVPLLQRDLAAGGDEHQRLMLSATGHLIAARCATPEELHELQAWRSCRLRGAAFAARSMPYAQSLADAAAVERVRREVMCKFLHLRAPSPVSRSVRRRARSRSPDSAGDGGGTDPDDAPRVPDPPPEEPPMTRRRVQPGFFDDPEDTPPEASAVPQIAVQPPTTTSDSAGPPTRLTSELLHASAAWQAEGPDAVSRWRQGQQALHDAHLAATRAMAAMERAAPNHSPGGSPQAPGLGESGFPAATDGVSDAHVGRPPGPVSRRGSPEPGGPQSPPGVGATAPFVVDADGFVLPQAGLGVWTVAKWRSPTGDTVPVVVPRANEPRPWCCDGLWPLQHMAMPEDCTCTELRDTLLGIRRWHRPVRQHGKWTVTRACMACGHAATSLCHSGDLRTASPGAVAAAPPASMTESPFRDANAPRSIPAFLAECFRGDVRRQSAADRRSAADAEFHRKWKGTQSYPIGSAPPFELAWAFAFRHLEATPPGGSYHRPWTALSLFQALGGLIQGQAAVPAVAAAAGGHDSPPGPSPPPLADAPSISSTPTVADMVLPAALGPRMIIQAARAMMHFLARQTAVHLGWGLALRQVESGRTMVYTPLEYLFVQWVLGDAAASRARELGVEEGRWPDATSQLAPLPQLAEAAGGWFTWGEGIDFRRLLTLGLQWLLVCYWADSDLFLQSTASSRAATLAHARERLAKETSQHLDTARTSAAKGLWDTAFYEYFKRGSRAPYVDLSEIAAVVWPEVTPAAPGARVAVPSGGAAQVSMARGRGSARGASAAVQGTPAEISGGRHDGGGPQAAERRPGGPVAERKPAPSAALRTAPSACTMCNTPLENPQLNQKYCPPCRVLARRLRAQELTDRAEAAKAHGAALAAAATSAPAPAAPAPAPAAAPAAVPDTTLACHDDVATAPDASSPPARARRGPLRWGRARGSWWRAPGGRPQAGGRHTS